MMLKKKIIKALSLLCVLGILLSSASLLGGVILAEGENLLVNGDLSQGSTFSVPGWSVDQNLSNGARMTNDGIYLNAWWGKKISQFVDLEANTTYELTFEGKKDQSGGTGMAGAFDKTGALIDAATVSTQSWQSYSLTFVTGNDATNTEIRLYNTSTNAQFRNLVLKKAETQIEKKLLINGDFSQGSSFSVPGWSVDQSLSNGARMTNDGVYLDVWWGKSVTQTVDLEPNKNYLLTFEAKISTTSGTGMVGLLDKNGTEFAKLDIKAVSWTAFELSFKTGADAEDTVIKLYNKSCNSQFRALELVEYTPYDDGKIIVNGDAEIGKNDGWTISKGKNGLMAIESASDTDSIRKKVSKDHAFTEEGGDYYFQTYAYNTLTQQITLEPNEEYILRMKYFSSTEGVKMSIKGNSVLMDEVIKPTWENWADYSINFTTGSDTEFTFTMITGTYDGSLGNYVAFDNLSIVKISDLANENYVSPPSITEFASPNLYNTDSTKNCFISGDFETVPEGGWNTEGFIDSGFISVSDEKSRGGDKSLKVEMNGDKKQTAVMWLELEKNTEYILSLSMLGEFMSETNLADMTIQLVNDKTGYALPTGNSLFNGIFPTRWDNDWHRRAVAFNTSDSDKIGIRISGKSASCYIDDVVVCKATYMQRTPQKYDKQVDPLLARRDYNSAIATDVTTDIVTCKDSDNLLKNGSLAGNDTSFWSELLERDEFELAVDHKDSTNTIIKYRNTSKRNYNMLKWVEVEPNTKYVAYTRIRGDVEGNAAFTVVTGTTDPEPVRLVNYTPERWDGVWQTCNVVFNTGDDTRIGFGFFDGGGGLSLDDFVLCKVEDATFTEAPELPPLPGEEEEKTPENNDTSSGNASSDSNAPSNDGTSDNAPENTAPEESEPERKPIYGKTEGGKDKTVYQEYVVIDWVTVGIIIGASVLGVIAAAVILIIILKKRKKKKQQISA